MRIEGCRRTRFRCHERVVSVSNRTCNLVTDFLIEDKAHARNKRFGIGSKANLVNGHCLQDNRHGRIRRFVGKLRDEKELVHRYTKRCIGEQLRGRNRDSLDSLHFKPRQSIIGRSKDLIDVAHGKAKVARTRLTCEWV